MAKLEKLVIGNAEATNLQSGNEMATPEAETPNRLNPVNAPFAVI
jgi:hypothetical protein